MNEAMQDLLNHQPHVRQALTILGYACRDIAADKGFWDEERNKGEMIALMHSELSEALEAVRKPHPDKHCPDFDNEVIELADCMIRIFDYATGFNLPLAEAIIAKLNFNASREYKHGKAF